MADTVEVPKEQLETLLNLNKQMKHDLKMIMTIAGDIMQVIGTKNINVVTVFHIVPKITRQIEEDPQQREFLSEENINRLRRDYES